MNPETAVLLDKLAQVPHLLDLALEEAQRGFFGTRERKVQFHEGDLHADREHGAPLPDALATLLRLL